MPVDNETVFPDIAPPTKKRCQKSVQRTQAYSVMLEAFVKPNEVGLVLLGLRCLSVRLFVP